MTDEDIDLTRQQQKATRPDTTAAITAGAGTGKTTTLTHRYRRILETDPSVDPTDIVTITFTRDAAAELKAGIREAIDEAAAAAPPDAAERWRRATASLSDAWIHTIHGLCSRILREYAVEADLSPEFATLDEAEARHLASTTASELVADALDERTSRYARSYDDQVGEDIRLLTRLFGRDELASLLVGLSDERPESDRWASDLLGMTPAEYTAASIARGCPVAPDEADALWQEPAVRDALGTLQGLCRLDLPLDPSDDDGAKTLAQLAEHLPDGDLDEVSTPDKQRVLYTVCKRVTTNKGAVTSQAWRYLGSSGTWSDAGLEAEQADFEAAMDVLIDSLAPADRNPDVDLEMAGQATPFLFAIARLYDTFRGEYDRQKRLRSAMDYTDLIVETVSLLEANERVRAELASEIDHLMVDEMQDTNPLQWDLVRLLATDGVDGPVEGLFLVGDEKQSIYRFRNADVTTFSQARGQLPDDAVDAALDHNFRTLSGPLSVINEVFDRLFQPLSGEHRRFEARPQPLQAARDEGTGVSGSVEYLVTPGDDAAIEGLGLESSWLDDPTIATTADREAAAVAARLTRLFADPPSVYDPDESEVVSAKPKHVAVLFRATTRLEAFERAFEEADIPYTSVGGRTFYDAPEITPLVSLLEVLADPTKDIPLLAVLRSPLCGHTDAELAPLYDPDRSLWSVLLEQDGRLGATADRLARWRALAGLDGSDRITSWAQLLSTVIEETGYLAAVGADERPQQAVVNVNEFRERIRRWEEGSVLPVSDIVGRIERERATGADPGDADQPSETTGVQLRTIHSAKGLEFPIVVIPELGRSVSSSARIGHRRVRGTTDLAQFETVGDEPVLGIKAPAPENELNRRKTPDWHLAADVAEAEERAESLRVLYVAMTRARDHLILSATHTLDETGEAWAPPVDPDEADCWRDRLQPILLGDDDTLTALRTSGTLERSLGDGTYRVSLPRPPAEGPGTTKTDREPPRLDVGPPPAVPARTAVSASEFRSLLDDGTSGAGHDTPVFEWRSDDSGLASNEFGTLVHRLCELALAGVAVEDADTVRSLIDRPSLPTVADIEAAIDHARRGIDAVDALLGSVDASATYQELPVTLTLDTGAIAGTIDHLTVTPERYVITDFKTDDMTDRTPEAHAEGYWPQLAAYACALQAGEPRPRVTCRLVFTDCDATIERTLDAAELEEHRSRYARVLAGER